MNDPDEVLDLDAPEIRPRYWLGPANQLRSLERHDLVRRLIDYLSGQDCDMWSLEELVAMLALHDLLWHWLDPDDAEEAEQDA